jgi:predicted RecA/RadA family phage recombinase
MKNYVMSGEKVELAAPYNVLSGGGALVGSIFGIAQADALSGATVVLLTRGVVDMAKTSAQAWTAGVRIYWDDATKLSTTTAAAGANKLIGVALAVADNPSAVGRVLLTGAFTI